MTWEQFDVRYCENLVSYYYYDLLSTHTEVWVKRSCEIVFHVLFLSGHYFVNAGFCIFHNLFLETCFSSFRAFCVSFVLSQMF